MDQQPKSSQSFTLTINRYQRVFIQYSSFILIDLTVLNLFDEFWELVSIPSFSVSLFTAIILQLLLKATLAFEHRISAWFLTKKQNMGMKVLKYFSLWVVLFGSKFLILGIIERLFGDKVLFLGPVHGVLAFIVVIVVMLLAEGFMVWIHKRLGV